MRSHFQQVRSAMGSWTRVGQKLHGVGVVVRNTVDRRARLARLRRLKRLGRIDAIPTEFQIWLACHEMFRDFILPSNRAFFEHDEQDEAWALFLRFLDEPAAMLDPSGLAISRDLLIAHLLHAVHVSAGYDVALLEIFPDGLDELERQCGQLIEGVHPHQAALMERLDRSDYPEQLLAAVRRYRADPEAEWAVQTYPAPEPCAPAMAEGLARFGTIGRLLRRARALPASPQAWLWARWVQAPA